MQRWFVICWALLVLVGADECPDGGRCEEGQTCCKNPTNGYECCPFEQAVCCEDKIHCCPEGSTCDEHSKCVSQSAKTEMPMRTKLPAKRRAEQEGQKGNDVPCTDTEACPDDNTCCRNEEGGWACCPLPEAVCCEDFIHCCHKGQKCNLAVMTCENGTHAAPLVEKRPTIPRQDAQVGNVPCDPVTSCPDGTTCCRTVSGDWGCCGLPQAVCCDDHEHCCPTGTTCDTTHLSCLSTSGSTPMKKKIPATTTVGATATRSQVTGTNEIWKLTGEEEDDLRKTDDERETEGVHCDAHTSCPDHTTCCFMDSTKMWGCCPLPEAVCCGDGNHCCPAQYKCNEHKTTCVKDGVEIPWYTKLPATSRTQTDERQSWLSPPKHKDVQCDDQTSCYDGQTCCRISSTQWGCCPFANAVCCSDMLHCCPNGYSCDETGSCSQNTRLGWHNWRMFLTNKKKSLIV